MVWLNESSEKRSCVIEFKRNPKNTGIILVCEHFECFMWNNDPLLKHLQQALAVWCDVGTGHLLEVVKDSKEKRGFTVQHYVENKKKLDCDYRFTEYGFTTRPVEESNKNPFLE